VAGTAATPSLTIAAVVWTSARVTLRTGHAKAMAETPRHPVRVTPCVADLYRKVAKERGVCVSALLIAELEAARVAALTGRGARLPRAPKPGRRKPGRTHVAVVDAVQLKWSQPAAEYERLRQILAAVGSSPTAVLRNPRTLTSVTTHTTGNT